MTELAIFDLDYTLTRRGTWGRFVSRAMRETNRSTVPLWLAAGLTQWRYKRGRLPRIAVKTVMMRHSIAGWTYERLAALSDAFVSDDVNTGLNSDVLEALQNHQAQGHSVLIASAAVDILVERYATMFKADAQVSTRLDWSSDGQLNAGFASPNCYGEEKLARIQAWMAETEIRPTFVTAYSDSCADAPMLEMADRAVMVRPKLKSRQYAQAQGFEIW